MANGFTDRNKGKAAFAELWLKAGNLVDKLSGIFGSPVVSQRFAMVVTATANTDFPVMSIPLNATLLRATVYTGVAFLAATDAKVSIGTSAGDQSYVAQTSIKAQGIVDLTLVAAAAASLLAAPAAPNLYVRITQTGTTSATGTATLVLEYTP
jgi:hypothetical protein